MSTSAISNVFSVLPTPASGGKQDGEPADAGAFNQVLSREMDRGAANRGPADAATKKDASATGGDKSGKDGTDASSSPTTEGGKVSGEENDTTVADAATDEADTDPAAAAELAAFLAAMTQANPAPATAAATDDAPVALPTDAKTTAGRPAIDPDADAVTTGLAATGKQEATGKGEDFVAALEKAATPAAGGKAAASGMKAEIDKAVTQVVKAVEAPAPTAAQSLAATGTTTLQQLDQLQTQQANRLMPQVGTPDWNQALGQKVVWMVQGVQQTATLTLNPPDLGPMQVTVNVQHNQATANFTAPQPEVRHALEAAMPRLREMLNEAGIQLGQSSVSAGSPDQQGNGFADSRQNGQGGNRAATAEATPTVSHVPTPAAGTGMVDTFA